MDEEKSIEQINIERMERLQAAERKEYEGLAADRNLFDVEELLNAGTIPRKLELPELGEDSFHVYYCPLNAKDRLTVLRIVNVKPEIQRDLQNRKMLYLMLHKADERWTEEKVDGLPATWVDAILIKIGREQNRFLQRLVRGGLAGLGQTPRLSKEP